MNQAAEKQSHTTGPWEFNPGPKLPTFNYVVTQSEKDQICRVLIEDDDDHEGIANAKLIAAAPELLAACKSAFELINHVTDGHLDLEDSYPVYTELN